MRLHLDEKKRAYHRLFWFRAVDYGTTGTSSSGRGGSRGCGDAPPHQPFSTMLWINKVFQ